MFNLINSTLVYGLFFLLPVAGFRRGHHRNTFQDFLQAVSSVEETQHARHSTIAQRTVVGRNLLGEK